MVRPHRTISNHCDEGGSLREEQFGVSLRRFDCTELFSNHCDIGGSQLTGKVRVSLGRFEYTEPPRITVTKGEAGLQVRLE